MNDQRKIIYGQRQRVLEAKDLKEMVLDMIKDRIYYAIDLYLSKDVRENAWDYAGLCAWARRKFGIELAPDELKTKDIDQTEELLVEKVRVVYDEREKILTAPMMREIEQFLLLQKIDEKWKDHLYAMDHLRSGIGLRGYAQIDPKIEYKREAFLMFTQLIESIKEETTDLIFKVRAEKPEKENLEKIWKPTEFKHQELGSFEGVPKGAGEKGAVATEKPRPVVVGEKVGRNDPCTCGSGKKYKKCCGAK